MKFEVGPRVIISYRRLAYTAWHAIAEFVDNSTQAYFNNRQELDAVLQREGEKLTVSVVYERSNQLLRVSDNSVGMSRDELERALHVAVPPPNTDGRSKYGMGMKTAACWIGNHWTIRTKKLGETLEHSVEVDVQAIASGATDVLYSSRENRPPEDHYTVLEVKDHNQVFQGRTISKIKQFLGSMYREDLRRGILTLQWQGASLTWDEPKLLVARDGTEYKKPFSFTVEGKGVRGWVGILDGGGRSRAGFSIIHNGRVVRGWPDSWRPQSLYGQLLGSNDLINQRLVGEVHLDDFDVSHTKDDILWVGEQEEIVERELLNHCSDYRNFAREYRSRQDDEREPSELDTQVAVEELRKELESPEMVDAVSIDPVLPQEVVEESVKNITETAASREETFRAEFGTDALHRTIVKGYLAGDLSTNDPYVVVESSTPDEVLVVVNISHPHWKQIVGPQGILNYLRHCTYDAIAEWQARQKVGRLDPNTINMLKDRLLRVPLEVEIRTSDASADQVSAGM